ncbi:efflux RND transporter periplasmic adaptor subunit [Planctomicrobium sp. SH527]|uniref:efflux RND transporter periplasmic adaptor subunit n=1 Tax=Planctomicrobium sp. SH527 TaxID=3448123 RepID=UPI003F5C41CA
MTQKLVIYAILVAAGVGAGYALAISSGFVSSKTAATSSDEHEGHDHDHDHDHGDESANEIVLSEQARKNLGLVVEPVRKSEFWRTIVVPGTISEQPGHSERRITTNVNGVVTKVYVLPGQTVRPGEALVDIQTTGEVLANAQSSLLKTVQEIELVDLELKRIEPLVEQGSIPGTRVLEKKYEKQRLETQQLVQIQELLVRGLDTDQIRAIMDSKILLRSFTIRVPSDEESTPASTTSKLVKSIINQVDFKVESPPPSVKPNDRVYSVENLEVYPGKLVNPGDELCTLALHTDLRVIGMAFQKDSELINQTIEEQRPVTVVFESNNDQPMLRENLKIQYADNVVDPESRLLRFYLPIKNEVIRDLKNPDGMMFRAWRFKPGQRVQLRVPVEHWTDKIVLPIAAVVREGAESYVFRENGTLMERVPVSVMYEDSRFAVLADDGSLFPDDPIAMNEAYQLNLALRKAQGGGVDLHAGHNH